ncbi:MAG TPA: ATP-binding cassette domain-containing protein [Spirochaetia bacterium]|nr:ATP-binding cassette domain-containing protein [Spirochaetia bacterium]
MSEDNGHLVRMVGIDKYFGRVCALNGADFSVKHNEIVSLVGDNGAGKSTLIKILSGFHTADKGEIWFEGKKVHLGSPRDAKNLGIETVYQEQALAPHLSISRNVFMGREISGALGVMDGHRMHADSIATLEKLGLRVKDSRAMVEQLSGGQRQGVAIARVLYFKAKLVILDEPTIALSVKESQQVMDFMLQLKNQGISVIFITHNLFHAFQIAERFVVLARGEVLADVERSGTSVEHLSQLVITGRHEVK